MSDVLDELISLLKLERSGDDSFIGQSQNLGWGRVFGGQVLGQALSAAAQTVPEDRTVHSFHGYFLRPGAVDKEIRFDVDRIRDGRSFTTRRVVANQNDEAIFSLSASFQIDEGGFEHQPPMPDAPDPDGLKTERELAKSYIARLPESVLKRIPPAMVERAVGERPIELRLTAPVDPISPAKRPPVNQVWFRANGALPDDPAIHRYLLAYASDFYLLSTSLLPHGATWMTPGMQVASLDHSMYFHRPFRFDEWLLYDMQGTTAVGARGLARGSWYNRDGLLVASTVQEGLIRNRRL